MRSGWLAIALVCTACGKVEKIEIDAAIDAPVDAAPDAPPPPVDPLVNGSFEMNYDGWTLNEDSGSPTQGFWGISTAMTLTAMMTIHDFTDNVDGTAGCLGAGSNVVEVADGSQAAFNTMNGPERHRIWQDVKLPPEAKTVTWNMSYANRTSAFDAANEFVAVEVRDPATDTVLTNLFYTDPTMMPALTTPLTMYSGSLAAYAGQTVRITVDVQARIGCMFTVVDNFHITF